MSMLQIAFRNVFRNRRRSLMTLSAVSVGEVSLITIGALLIFIMLDFQSGVVRRIGHLTVYKAGYFEYGLGDASQYGIDHYQAVMSLFDNDPVLKPLIRVSTPVQDVMGLVGNYAADRSRPFIGAGVDVRDHARMGQWDGFGLGTAGDGRPDMPDSPDAAVVGTGLARILGFCGQLRIPDCPPDHAASTRPGKQQVNSQIEDLLVLNRDGARRDGGPRIDLLSATAGGAPNVVSAYVAHSEREGGRTADDSFVLMHLALAQELVYGRGEHKVTGIEIQVYHTKDMAAASARLQQLFALHHLNCEVRDFTELTPLYPQVLGFFVFLFSFVSVVLVIIVLFTTINTMSMAVMERISEIGTLRALGLQRGQVRWQFVFEGCLLGVLGATAGAILAYAIALLINSSKLTWVPPTAAGPVPLKLTIPYWLVIGTWAALSAVSSVASVFPASRASKMTVVDALRHV